MMHGQENIKLLLDFFRFNFHGIMRLGTPLLPFTG
jgi:hypothetical protein